MHRIAVLGSTGSIGTNCLEVIGALPERLDLRGVAARSSWQLLGQQTERFAPRWAVLSDTSLKGVVPRSAFSSKTELLFGPEGVERLAADPEIDVIVSGIVGAAGWPAPGRPSKPENSLHCQQRDAGRRRPIGDGPGPAAGAEVLPVDSEHSAVFQALQSGRKHEVKRIVLTASGGPFRGLSAAQLEQVTPEMALAHPTWNMGKKISVDSATMMNKALEVIEAKWLFGLEVDQIQVVVHPQSIMHSFVEFVDGSVMGQLSPPDMKLPIQYALTYPERMEGVSPKLDWTKSFQLEFEPPDLERFPALALGFEVARRGGTCGAVLNAANEAAVERFLNRDLKFSDIPRACRAVLEAHDFDPSPSLQELLAHDRRARQEIQLWKSER